MSSQISSTSCSGRLCVFDDRVGVAIPPRFPDLRKDLARHTERIHDDVIDRELPESEIGHQGECVASDVKIGTRRALEHRRRHVPESIDVMSGRRHLDHAVVLDNQMNPPVRLRHARELDHRVIGVRNRLEHMTADGEIEAVIGIFQLEYIALRKRESAGEFAVAPSRQIEMRVDDVDRVDARVWKQNRDAISPVPQPSSRMRPDRGTG